ncbi:MAG TPA: hypothetical protein VMY41_12660 [Thermohalobaculum sp.]|nr:hypothetical protein [Thermohalobaculum sp.]
MKIAEFNWRRKRQNRPEGVRRKHRRALAEDNPHQNKKRLPSSCGTRGEKPNRLTNNPSWQPERKIQGALIRNL